MSMRIASPSAAVGFPKPRAVESCRCAGEPVAEPVEVGDLLLEDGTFGTETIRWLCVECLGVTEEPLPLIPATGTLREKYAASLARAQTIADRFGVDDSGYFLIAERDYHRYVAAIKEAEMMRDLVKAAAS